MASPVEMSWSRTYPLTVDQAFDLLLPLPLERIFARRFGPIPAVRGTDGPREAWGVVGQTRTVRLADGGSMREELTEVARPERFAYRLTEITGPMKPVARLVEGTWGVEPAGTGARITWSWRIHPASAISARLVPVIARFWRGYARRSLDRLEHLLLAASS